MRAAFFDFDGTIIDCQSHYIFAKRLCDNKIIPKNLLWIFGIWFLFYKAGLLNSTEQARKLFYRRLTKPISSLQPIIDAVSSELKSHIRPAVAATILNHKSSGDLVIAISASLKNLCEPVCNFLGIDIVCATLLESRNGFYTGKWIGEILESDKKADLVFRLSVKYKINLANSYFYSDSFADLPSFKLVGHPVAVSPDNRLKKISMSANWLLIDN